MRTQPELVTLLKPGIPPKYRVSPERIALTRISAQYRNLHNQSTCYATLKVATIMNEKEFEPPPTRNPDFSLVRNPGNEHLCRITNPKSQNSTRGGTVNYQEIFAS